MSLQLSRSEQAAVYTALVPGFRADRRRYPTEYRGGDSSNALAIDLERGWFDHVTGEGGDCITLTQCTLRCDFHAAARWISDIIGRDLLRASPRLSKYSHSSLAEAELFVVGFRWAIERRLATLKAPLLEDGDADEQLIRGLTALLAKTQAWNAHEASAYLREVRWRTPQIVTDCIQEAREAQLALANAIAQAGSERAAA